MGRYAIQCPQCGTVNKKGFFASKITCDNCGTVFGFGDHRKMTINCPYCHETVIVDQKEGANPECPLCHNAVQQALGKQTVRVECPQCNCGIMVDRAAVERPGAPYPCPICDAPFDLRQAYARSKLVSDTGVSVIQYEGDNSTFVWKHPIEDFNSGSQLIVHESQEAVFFLNGQALDSFAAGRHTLETENLPVLRAMAQYPTDGGRTPFHAEVYFVNLTVQMGLRWGTDSRVHFIDPLTGIPLDIGASGELNLQVSDPRKLLIKLVGTDPHALKNTDVLSGTDHGQTQPDGTVAPVQQSLRGFFRAPLMNAVKSNLGACIAERRLNIFEIDAHMGELSELLREKVLPYFTEYGLTIPQLFITNISLPDDKNVQELRALMSKAYLGVKREEIDASVALAARDRKVIEQVTDAQLQVIRAQGEAEAAKTTGFAQAEVMRAQGYNQQDLIQADVQKAFAAGLGQMGGSGGGGSVAGDVIGVVAGLKAADAMTGRLDGLFAAGAQPTGPAPVVPPGGEAADTWACSCGASGNTGRFCSGCGAPKPEEWACACGQAGNKGKFCSECGRPKPAMWDCPCGHTGNRGKFCEECGKPMGAE